MQNWTFKLLILFLAQAVSHNLTFEQVKAAAENRVKTIAQQISDQYRNRCSSLYTRCQFQFFNGCEGTAQRMCFEQFQRPNTCNDKGAILSQKPIITFPTHKNQNNLNEVDVQLICNSAKIDEVLKENENPEIPFRFSYYANYEGIMKSYPGIKVNCGDYDPRFRPWYVAAATGRKNVFLLIDISGSMDSNRIVAAKKAAQSVLNTLGPADTVVFIKFNQEAKSLYYNRIVEATIENKQNILKEIQKISAGGQTNYTAAFQMAFKMLKQAQQQESGAINCLQTVNVVLFLTDGVPTQGETTFEKLSESLDEYNSSYPFHLFTYSIGSIGQVNTTLLKALSCRYRGINFDIDVSLDNTKLLQSMRQYYDFISSGIKIQNAIWSEPYVDAWVPEDIITVVFPIYYQEPQKPRIILGVVGTDLSFEYLSQFGVTKSNALQKFVSSIPCQQNKLTECQLQELRKQESDQAVCHSSQDCTIGQSIAEGCIDASYPSGSTIFSPNEDDSSQYCCDVGEEREEQTDEESSSGVGIGIGVGVGVVVIGIIVGVGVYLKKKKGIRGDDGKKEENIGSGNQMKNDEMGNDNNLYANPYANPHGDPYVNPYLKENSNLRV